MILLLHPRSTRPKNRRFPLSVLALAAVLEGKEEYEIVDANLDPRPMDTIGAIQRERPARMLCVSVMPGPQMAAAIPLSREFRARHPDVPIVWGGYFPSLYPDTVLRSLYVDAVVRGQGEDTLVELVGAMRQGRDWSGIPGLSFRDAFGLAVHAPDRPIRSPGDFPWMPYHRLRQPEQYIARTFLGSRTAVHHASYGCPYRCSFCAVPGMTGARQKSEAPERTAAILAYLQKHYGIDAVQFYDNNFFLREADAAELAARIAPLRLQWWCEARVDILLRFSHDTLRALRRAGCEMIFFGAESGDDRILREMNKRQTAAQILETAARTRQVGITPEFSFVIGNPRQPERDARSTMSFIRRLKRINPAAEIIVQHYVPTPHPDGMYGATDGALPDPGFAFPRTLEEWASPRWYSFSVRQDPALPWLPRKTQRRIDAFETVLQCRWPTVQDTSLPAWARRVMQLLASWRYWLGVYAWPLELELALKLLKPRRPKLESV
jgi:radical SAM superfamily enzyme YgiQ (UPF0313 family)